MVSFPFRSTVPSTAAPTLSPISTAMLRSPLSVIRLELSVTAPLGRAAPVLSRIEIARPSAASTTIVPRLTTKLSSCPSIPMPPVALGVDRDRFRWLRLSGCSCRRCVGHTFIRAVQRDRSGIDDIDDGDRIGVVEGSRRRSRRRSLRRRRSCRHWSRYFDRRRECRNRPPR